MLDAEHLRAKADECRTRAKIESDSVLHDALMSLADKVLPSRDVVVVAIVDMRRQVREVLRQQ